MWNWECFCSLTICPLDPGRRRCRPQEMEYFLEEDRLGRVSIDTPVLWENNALTTWTCSRCLEGSKCGEKYVIFVSPFNTKSNMDSYL